MLDIRFTIPTLLFAAPAAALVLGMIALRTRRSADSIRRWWAVVTGLYLVGLATVVFFPFQVNIGRYAGLLPWWSSVNLWPIVTIDPKTFLVNVVLLVPLGVILPALTSVRTFWRVTGVGAVVSIGIELAQIAFGTIGATRTGDVNDVIANTAGAAIGFAVFAAVRGQRTLRGVLPTGSSAPRRGPAVD
jgi:glycopeptide antibiotics resistance protein